MSDRTIGGCSAHSFVRDRPCSASVRPPDRVFCSARAPGDAILRAHDAARRMCDEGVTVISGFHSPIENECLRILLRGKQLIIIC